MRDNFDILMRDKFRISITVTSPKFFSTNPHPYDYISFRHTQFKLHQAEIGQPKTKE